MKLGDITRRLVDNRDKIDKGLDAAGGLARKRFGHSPKIDQGIGRAKQFLDTQAGKQTGTQTEGPDGRPGPR